MQPVRLGRVLLVAAVSALIPLAGKVIETFLTEQTDAQSWLVVPAVGVAVAMATALVEAFGAAKERGQTPLVVALVVSVAVIGLGGLGLTAVVRPAAGAIKESLDERTIESFVLPKDKRPPGYRLEETPSSVLPSSSSSSSLLECSGEDVQLRNVLAALGFKRCLITVFAKTLDTRTYATNRVLTYAWLMRDDEAASKLLSTKDGSPSLTPGAKTDDDDPVRQQSVPVEQLGDEASPGLEITWKDMKYTEWRYTWRRGNVVAGVSVHDLRGEFNRRSALRLARSVDEHAAG